MANTIMEPTNGRIVWFTPALNDNKIVKRDKPLAAIVCDVWNPRMVNLSVVDANGQQHACTSVTLVQEGDPKPSHGYYCEWMPYQLGQAKANELKQQIRPIGKEFGEPFVE